MLGGLGANYARKIAVMQPHVRKEVHDRAREATSAAAGRRLIQLDTLLLGVDAACHSLGATFSVISSL